jgi:rhamnosyltransferase
MPGKGIILFCEGAAPDNAVVNLMKTPAGLIVTFNPSSEFFPCLDSLCAQFDQILVVDNGSSPEVRDLLEQEVQRRKSALVVIFNETNLGVAVALNQGFRWALEQDYVSIIAFDQDSHPAPGMIPALFEVYNAHSKEGRLAVVAPVIVDPVVNVQARFLRPKNKLLYERVSCEGDVLENVTYVITSGSLFNLAAYRQIGPFRDDFFIDYVDTEYCLRARQYGYRILAACNARLYHRQGDRQKRVIWGHGHYPTFHSPLRWYYISRNRIPMLRRYALCFPHWLLYEMVATGYVFLRMLLFEPQKLAKLQAFFLGTWDGFRGRMGKVMDSVLKKIEHGQKSEANVK